MNAYFYTLGCKVNQYETQSMMKLMEQQGIAGQEYVLGQPDVGESVIVINSCTVTGESDRKLRQLLRRCRRDNPHAIIVLTGCLPQAFPEQAKQLEQADIVLGNAARQDLPRQIRQFLSSGTRLVEIPNHRSQFEELSIDAFEGRTRAFVKIEDGCNRFCSYCIIPYARGRVRSRSLEDLREELKRLVKNGYTEAVLVGINLTAYGQDIGLCIADAVECACSVEGLLRVRLGSIEPDHMTPDIVWRLAQCEKLCPQFHLALQSGCDATLKRMNRHYTTAQYRTVCDNLRKAFPQCAITTDVMVGFPGETQEEFEQSLAFVKDSCFSRIHCFAYSRRAGTPAAKAPNQVSSAEKAHRSRCMTAVGQAGSEAFAASFIGKTVSVLPETVREDGCTEGHTDTYVPVVLNGGTVGVVTEATVISQQNGICYARV